MRLQYVRCATTVAHAFSAFPYRAAAPAPDSPAPFGSQVRRLLAAIPDFAAHALLLMPRVVSAAARLPRRAAPAALSRRDQGPRIFIRTDIVLAGQAISRHKTPADTAAVEANEPLIVLCRSLADTTLVVGDTGIEPVTSSVSGKRAPAAPIARGGYRIRTGVNGFAGRCLASRPTHHENAGARRSRLLGADDGTRTRDPHLGKVMLYQLSHIRVHSTDPYRGAWRWKTITSSRPPRANDSAVIHLTRASFARRHRRWIACPPHRAIGSGVRAPRSHRGGHWFDSSIAHHDAPT